MEDDGKGTVLDAVLGGGAIANGELKAEAGKDDEGLVGKAEEVGDDEDEEGAAEGAEGEGMVTICGW